MAKMIICNVCSKEFNQIDKMCGINFKTQIGYGSKYDGECLDMDICCSCFDKGMEKLLKCCKVSPIT